jgi:hypothetical protein
MRCKVLPAPRTHLQHTTTIRWTASQTSHLGARMPPEMQPPPSTLSREVITISVFVLVEGRKRRDSNPRVVAHLSLSRPSTDSSGRITPAVSAGQQPPPVLSEYRRPGANATRIATGVGRNHAVRAIVFYPRTCFSTIDCCNCARQQTGETPAWLGESRGGCDTVAGARMNGGPRPLVGTCSLSTVAAGWPAIVRGSRFSAAAQAGVKVKVFFPARRLLNPAD